MLKDQLWVKLQKELEERKIIFLGEMHGAGINAHIIELFVNELDIDVILIELEQKWNKYLEELIRKKEGIFYKKLLKEKWLINSGLISKKHVELFKKLLKTGKRIYAVKVYGKTWNSTDKLTAKNILRIARKNKDKKMLIVVGNLHIRKKEFRLEGKKILYKPVGLHLKNKAIAICIRYGEGVIKNFKPIKLNDKIVIKKLRNKKQMLAPAKSKYFDYYFFVKNT